MKGNEKNDSPPRGGFEIQQSRGTRLNLQKGKILLGLAIYFVLFLTVPFKVCAYEIYTIEDPAKSIKIFQFLEKISIMRNKVLQLQQTIKKSQNPQVVNTSNIEGSPEKSQSPKAEKEQIEQMHPQYHFFVYPYFIYEFKNITTKEITQLLRREQKENLTLVDQDVNSTQSNESTEEVDQDKRNKSTMAISQLFLFRKIQVCSNEENYKLLNLLPNNIFLITDSDQERVNVFPLTENSLLFQSILQDQQKGIITVSVQMLQININNWIFFHIKNNLNYDKLFIQYKIFEDQVDISQKISSKFWWDFSFNGSSIRFAKLRKNYVYKYLAHSYSGGNLPKRQDQLQIISKFQDFTTFLNKSSEMKFNSEPKIRVNQTETFIELIESSLNVDPMNKRDRYKVKFCDEDYQQQTQIETGYRKSYRVSFIGNSKKSDFFMMLPKYPRDKKKMMRIIKTSLKNIQTAEVFYQSNICQNSLNPLTFIQKFDRGSYQDILIYFEQQCNGKSLNNSVALFGRLRVRQVNYPQAKNILQIEEKEKIREYEILVQNPKSEVYIEKISPEHLSICRKHSQQICCQLLNSYLFKIHQVRIPMQKYESMKDKKISEIIQWRVKLNILNAFKFRLQIYILTSILQAPFLFETILINNALQSLRNYQALSNSSQLILISDFVSIQQKMSNSTSSSLFPEQQFVQTIFAQNSTSFQLSSVQNSIYLPETSYNEKSTYIGKIWARKLQNKLKILYSNIWKQSVSEQLSNCETVNQYGKVSGIRFKGANQNQDNNWKICRLFIETTYQNLVIQPDYDSLNGSRNISNPYKIYQCSIKTTETQTRCIYSEWEGKDFHALHQHAITIFFFIRKGTPYNLKVMDLNLAQMDEIAQSFLIMFICILSMTCLLTFLIVCRPFCILACTYMGWMNTENQTMVTFRYPLNCVELILKIKKLKKQRVIKQYKQRKYRSSGEDISLSEQQMEDDCVFCLQQKIKGEEMIEVYCKHTYHKDCFSDWVRQQRNLLCPMCKRRLSIEGLNEYNQNEKELKENKKQAIVQQIQ